MRMPGGLLDGAHQQRRAAEGVGRVELVAPVPGDRHVGVARQADQRRGPGARLVQQDHRVGALPGRLADVQLALTCFLDSPARLSEPTSSQSCPGVGRRPAGVVLQGVDLADAGVEEPHQRDERHHDHAAAPAVRCAATDRHRKRRGGRGSSGVGRRAGGGGAGGGPAVARCGAAAPAGSQVEPPVGSAGRRITWVGSSARFGGAASGAGPAGAPPRSQPSGQLLMSASLHRPYPCRSCPTPRHNRRPAHPTSLL